MSARSARQLETAAARGGGGLDLLHARVALRDRTVSDVLDLALRFVVVHGRVYAKVATIALLPLVALSAVAGWRLGWAASWAIAVPLAAIGEIPFTVLASRLVFQDRVRARDVLGASLRDGPKVIFARGLAALLAAVGLFVLVIPGLWLTIISFFLGEVILLERGSAGQVLGRSHRVASSAGTEVLLGGLVLLLLAIASVLLADVAGRLVLGELLQFRPPPPVWHQGGSLLATLGLFLFVPYLATARFFLYLNVRTRAEGWDIQTRFAAIAARAKGDATDTRST